jgi:hypothetical protein
MPKRDHDKEPDDLLELWLSRRRFLRGVGAIAIAGAIVVVKTDTPERTSLLAGKPGTRWIGHC